MFSGGETEDGCVVVASEVSIPGQSEAVIEIWRGLWKTTMTLK